ncbi:MAG: inverse autotransporter beta domain-containing protein [Ferrovibrio sp.]|uniref:inverse autotransporter beta domain-containing protein n=1 Tax=Ferrovibrio sp. TaxID=1917215 RepID=UPI003919FC99
MQWVGSLAIAAIAIMLLPAAATSQPAERAPKWTPHIDVEGKTGTKRNLGEADLFVPLAQDGTTLLFTSLRTRMDDSDGLEGNFGLGLRHMLESGWNLGAYAYFDRRKSELENYFSQVTLGFEALSLDWDLRANAYLPQGRRSHQVDALNTAEVSGTNVIFRGGEERSLSGFDAEIGWRLPFFDSEAAQQLRLYAGGYRFTGDDDAVPDVQGPRLRAEMVFDAVPGLWDGARLSLGAEWQHDDPRGSQGFLSARLRIPLQSFGRSASQLMPMERRMADPVVRDIDIVSRSGAFGAPETATQTANGGSLTVLNSASTSGANLATAVTNAGNNSTVLLSGTFNTTNTVSLATGQTLTGAVTVRSASGRLASVSTGATVNASNLGSTVQVNSGGTVSNLTVTNAFSGGTGGRAVLVADGVSNATISNNTITVTQSGANGGVALTLGNNVSAVVRGNTLTATGSGAATTITALAANVGSPSITVANNSISASGGTTNNMVWVGAGTVINAGSTGNIRGSGACNGTPASGSIGFTNGTTCP